MSHEFITLLDKLRRALDASVSLTPADLAAASGLDEGSPDFNQAVRFLHTRDEVLVDAAARTLHSRRSVSVAILAQLELSARSLPDLTKAVGLSTAVTAEAVGWLEREGRLEVVAGKDGDVVRVRRPNVPPVTNHA